MAKKRRALKVLLITTVIVVGAVWFEASRLGLTSASEKLAEQLRLAKRDGLPLTPSELSRTSVADNQNAAQIVLNSEIQLHMLSGDPGYVISEWGASYVKPPVTDAAARKAFAELAPILKLAEQASLRPHLDLRHNWNTITSNWEGISLLSRLAAWVVARARLDRIDGHISIAGQDLEVAARLTRLLAEVPDEFALVVRARIESRIFSAAAELLRKGRSASAIASLRHVLALFGPLLDTQIAAKGEFVRLREIIPKMAYASEGQERASSGSGPMMDDTFYPPEWELMRLKSIAEVNEANAIQAFRKLYAVVPADPLLYNRSFAGLKLIESQIYDNDHPFENMAVNFAVQPMSYMVDSAIESMARRRLLAAALDILSRPAFPTSWSRPGPDGIDPFTDKPFVYRRTKDGFVIYSFGKDRKDDGGRPYQLDNDPDHRLDISFEYPTLSVKPVPPPPKPRSLGAALTGGD